MYSSGRLKVLFQFLLTFYTKNADFVVLVVAFRFF